MVNKNRLIKLTRKLISINSQNPPGDESQIAKFVQGYLQGLGIKARICQFKKNRSNLIARLKGKNNKNSLLITPHLDTVPTGRNWSRDPFSGAIYKDRIYGLGATDCKGMLASALEAMNSLVEDRIILDYDLILAATADEESGSGLGLIPLLNKGILKPTAALVLDSDDFGIIVAQKGLLHLKVKIKGKKAHGAYPSRGVNAIDTAINILNELKNTEFKYIKNKYLRPPTLNIGTIKGGDKVNVVADWCEFELDLRFLPGMTGKDLLKDIENIIAKHTKDYETEIEGIQAPYAIEENHPLVLYLIRAMKHLKIKSVIEGSEGATVITFFQERNIPAIATGFGSKGCEHTADEYVKIDNLYKGALVLEEFLKSYEFGASQAR